MTEKRVTDSIIVIAQISNFDYDIKKYFCANGCVVLPHNAHGIFEWFQIRFARYFSFEEAVNQLKPI
jgi:Cu2+-containing amine oxidase